MSEGNALPAPSPQAEALSQALAARIAGEIERAGGWIGFDRYMHKALYEPALGYYAAGSRKFGADGDFVTAPELTPLFGQCVAVQCAHWFASAPHAILEFGAGSGALAAQLLDALDALGVAPRRYDIVEVSAELRERQHRTLAGRVPALLERVRWLDALPARIEGVIVANEVLDAMPVRLFRLRDDAVFERGVARTPGGRGFAFADRPADPAFARRVRDTLACAQERMQGEREAFPPDYVSEIGEQAQAWVETVAARLARGAMLLIDYGFPCAEYYHPQRSSGTLQCHYRHRAHADPFVWPGLQDITAHVDFTAVSRAARRAGLASLGYGSQARFLLDCGLLDRFARVPRDDARRWTREAQAVQQLVSESEMGELFKAVAFGRDVPDDAPGFATRDRRGVLA
ncbi:MAG: SAM-dependent methyltransferase [Burkholderiaceae bacterium]|nr:SAM-dependent methyltransferase [Burkholderiaceae bacterium]